MKIPIEQPGLEIEDLFPVGLKLRNKTFYVEDEIELAVDDLEFLAEVPPLPKKGQLPPPLSRKKERKLSSTQVNLLPKEIKKETVLEVHFDGEKEELKIETLAVSLGSKEHEHNEDSILVNANQGFVILCDGMGGIGNGEYASRKATIELQKQLMTMTFIDEGEKSLKKIEVAIRNIAKEIDKGGTTLSVIKLMVDNQGNKKALIANVGDSKVFRRKNNGGIEALTEEKTTWSFFVENINDKKMMKKLFDKILSKTISEKLFNYVMTEIYQQPDPKKYLEEKILSYHKKTLDQVKKEKDRFFIFYRELNRHSEGLTQNKIDFSVQAKIISLSQGEILFATSDGVHDNLLTSEMQKAFKTGNIEELNDIAQLAHRISLSKMAVAKPDDISIVGLKIAA